MTFPFSDFFKKIKNYFSVNKFDIIISRGHYLMLTILNIYIWNHAYLFIIFITININIYILCRSLKNFPDFCLLTLSSTVLLILDTSSSTASHSFTLPLRFHSSPTVHWDTLLYSAPAMSSCRSCSSARTRQLAWWEAGSASPWCSSLPEY